MLDVLAAVLSHGDSTVEIGKRGGETRVSQVFIAIDIVALSRAGAEHFYLGRIEPLVWWSCLLEILNFRIIIITGCLLSCLKLPVHCWSGETSLDAAAQREREMWQTIDAVVADVRGADSLVVGESVRCPGDGTVSTRQENQIRGAPVDAGLWAAVRAMQ